MKKIIFEEEILRKSANIGLKSYVTWLKKEKELKMKLKLYLENLQEMSLGDGELCKIIDELIQKIDGLNFQKPINLEVELGRFLLPMKMYININQTSLYPVCQAMKYHKSIFESNINQGVLTLEYMNNKNIMLSPRKCNDELLLLLIQYSHTNRVKLQERVLKNIIYPKTKIYKRFQEIFAKEVNYAEYFNFVEKEFPEYILNK